MRLRIVLLEDVNDAMTLSRGIIDPENGRVLLGVGCGNLLRFSDRLKKAGVKYLYVEDEVSAGIEIPRTLRDDVRSSAEQALKSVFAKLQLKEQPDYIVLLNCVKEMVSEVLRIKDNMINAFELRIAGGTFIGHAVNVAILSLIIGKGLYFDEEKLRKLGLGAILHDIGMAGLPLALAKSDRMSETDRLMYEQHPMVGYHLVKDSWEVSASSRGAILSHHERSNGSGYPRCIPKEDIHEFSRIVGLADLLDELTGGHPFTQRWSIQDAVEYLTIQAEALFDPETVQVFVSRIPLYPTGATVRTSDGKNAVVCGQNAGFSSRPLVRMIPDSLDEKVNPGIEIDLLHNSHIQLERA